MLQADLTPSLAPFEIPAFLVEPALRMLRLSNAALDAYFYDVGVLATELLWRGELVSTLPEPLLLALKKPEPPSEAQRAGFGLLNLGALSNPEGCILVVDSAKAPFVTRFDSVNEFTKWLKEFGTDVETVTITGVGSSALGSAAFAWNASMALGQRVAAIVPGYGVADVIYQGLGGWYGFGVMGWLESLLHEMVGVAAPVVARVGKNLVHTLPRGRGAQPYVTGNPASDVLHALLNDAPQLSRLLGHSKGALVIENAVRALDTTASRLQVTTFGCPISRPAQAKHCIQFLGNFDSLGWLNSWGHHPNVWIPTQHSTNTSIPYGMPVAILMRFALALEQATEAAAETAKLSEVSALPIPETGRKKLAPASV